MQKRKIIIQITKDGEVKINAECFVGDECMKNEIVRKLIEILQKEGMIDEIQRLNQNQTQKQELTEEQYW